MAKNPPVLGQSFAELKQKAREIPEVRSIWTVILWRSGISFLLAVCHSGYTQVKLAELAGTTQHRISEIESGEGNVTMKIMNDVFRCLKLQSLDPKFFDEQTAAY